MADLGSLVVKISLNNSQFSGGVLRVITETRKLDRTVNQTSGAMQAALTGAFTSISTAAIGLGKRLLSSGLDFAKWGLKLAAEAEQAQIAFKTILGSSSVAEKTLKELRTFANTTPFEFPEIRDSAKQLAAFGVEADDLAPTLRRLGDLSAGLGVPLQDLAYLYGTTRVQGRLFAADLNQFTSRGIPLIQELAKQFGVSDAQVKKLVSDGKVGFPEVQKALESLTDEGGKFHDLTAEQAKSLAGRYSTLQDSITNVAEVAGTKLASALNLKGAIEHATEYIDLIGKGLPGAFDAMQVAGVNAFDAIGNAIDRAGSKAADFAAKGFSSLQVLATLTRAGVHGAAAKVDRDIMPSLLAGAGTEFKGAARGFFQSGRSRVDSLLAQGGAAAGRAAQASTGVKSVFDSGVTRTALGTAAKATFGNKTPAAPAETTTNAAAPTPLANLLGNLGSLGGFGAGLFGGFGQKDLLGMLPKKAEIGTTSALAVGSAEAFSALNQRNRPQEKTAEQQLAELKAIKDGILKLVTGGAGLLVEQVGL